MDTTAGAERPWAQGIGLLVLGLAVSVIANAFGLHGETGAVARTLGAAGYAGGLVVAGAGVHRILWVGPSRRPRWVRLLISAVVTLPAFVALGIVLGLLAAVFQLRFSQ